MKYRIFLVVFSAGNPGLLACGVVTLLNPDVLLESFSSHVCQFLDNAND